MLESIDQQDREEIELLQRIRNCPWEFSKYVFTKDEADKKVTSKRFPYQIPYMKLYFKILQKETRVVVPKSRRMMMTWANVVYMFWDTMFHPGRHNAVVSKKEDDADWMLEKRFKFIYDHLDPIIPKQFLPKMVKTYNKLEFPEIESMLQGFPQGEDQLRMYTLSNIFADELAFWPKAEGTYSASVPTLEGGGTFIGISSPAPGFFKKMVYDKLDNEDAQGDTGIVAEHFFPLKGVEVWKNPKNEFFVFQLHFTADPRKRSPEFKKATQKGISLKRWKQEYDLSWETYLGYPVFTDFSKSVHGATEIIKPQLGLPLLRGWDFGLTPACIVAQVQEEKLVILKEYTAQNMGIKRFSKIVVEDMLKIYPGWSDQKNDFLDYIDPSGYFRKDTDESTCADLMRVNGIHPKPGELTWERRRDSVETCLVDFNKGQPNFVVNLALCPVLLLGFEGGYRYPEKSMEEEPNKIRPIKDEHSHPHDALQMITGAVKLIKKKQRRNRKDGERRIPRQGYSFNRRTQ